MRTCEQPGFTCMMFSLMLSIVKIYRSSIPTVMRVLYASMITTEARLL